MRRTEYTTVEVVHVGGEARGKHELDFLIREGWQIVDKDYYEDGPDADGYTASVLRYKLQR
jgi:hypothetical protein